MRHSLKYIVKANLGRDTKLIGAEIGVRAGENALHMLQSINLEHLYLVDHYKPHKESSGVEVTQEQQDMFYEMLMMKIKPFLSKTTVIKESSVKASEILPDNYFDFVYIDAGHKYEEVMQDMRLWLPKVKRDGFLCGHDFRNKETPEVEQAVRTFCTKHGLSLMPMDDIDWLVQKP